MEGRRRNFDALHTPVETYPKGPRPRGSWVAPFRLTSTQDLDRSGVPVAAKYSTERTR